MSHCWPTIWTTPLLIFGVLPLIYVGYKATMSRNPEGLSLRVWSVAVTWVAYQASPFLSYFFGVPWTSTLFEMAEQHIDRGLLCSDLCFLAILWGYHVGCQGEIRQRRSVGEIIRQVNVPASAIVLVTAAYLVLFVISVGGWHQVWTSTEARGEFQWMDVDAWWRIRRVADIVCTIGSPAVAAMATIHVLQRSRNRGLRPVLAATAIALSMCHSAHFFSRTTGLPLIIAGVLRLNLRGLRAWRCSAFVIGAGMYFSMVGLTQRANFDPGVGNYLAAITRGVQMEGGGAGGALDLGRLNPLCAMERFTLKAEIKEVDQLSASELVLNFFWNLHPFPSVLVPLKELGTEPTDYVQFTNISGIPAPALGDLYYVFGYLGCVFYAFMGWIYGWFDRLRARQPGMVSALCYFLCIASIGASTHTGCRPWTRYVFYAVVTYFAGQAFYAWIAPKRRRRVLATSRSWVRTEAGARPTSA